MSRERVDRSAIVRLLAKAESIAAKLRATIYKPTNKPHLFGLLMNTEISFFNFETQEIDRNMTRTLDLPGGAPRVLLPTTTTKLAQRMLYASRAISDVLPIGFFGSPALDLLLALHIAEESAQYPNVNEISLPGSLSPAVTTRWVSALVNRGLIEERDELLALTCEGHELVIKLIEGVYAVQRTLD